MKPDVKKFILLNLPYVFLFWIIDKGAECYRLAANTDIVSKILSIVTILGTVIKQNPLPSFHPQDLMAGAVGAVAIRLIVYIRAKNAKKYRHGIEYGSAR